MPRNIDISSPEFRERITSLRRRRNLSRREVAEAIDISPRAYTNWETGRQKTAMEHNVLRLADFLEVDFDYLINGRHAEHDIPSTEVEPSAPRHSRLPVVAIVIVVVVGLFVAGFFLLQRERRHDVLVSAEGNRVTVRDGIVGWPLWADRFDSNISLYRVLDWGDERVVVLGLDGPYPDTGRLMVRRAGDGMILWEDRPDLAEAGRVFGPVGAETEGFGVRRVETGDIDGDGVFELIVQYGHRRWYPNYVRIYRRDGSVMGTYYNCGSCYDVRAVDIDRDGKDEVLVAATNNGKAYQGATVILLDDKHCNGASRDSLMMSDCPLPDSSAVRVVFPQWDQRYMNDCGARPGSGRLQAGKINTHFTPDGSARISVDMGVGSCTLIMVFDERLHPLRVDLADNFVGSMSTWPEDDRRTFNEGLEDWMNSYYRYGSAADE